MTLPAQSRRALIVLGAIAATTGLGHWMTPRQSMARLRPDVPLVDMVPEQFAGWRLDRSVIPLMPPPDLQAELDRVYQQQLGRTYVDARGYRMMLSIAYGADQSRGLAMHRPEVCYPAQGFNVSRVWSDQIDLGLQKITVSRAKASLGGRHEPLTYWMLVGDEVVGPGTQARWAVLRSTLRGWVPDGLLVRLSSIDRDAERAFATQDSFARALVQAVDPAFRQRLVGLVSP